MKKLFSILLAIVMCFSVTAVLVACQGDGIKTVDYVAMQTLDLNSSTKKMEVTVKQFIDGDTTHFNPTSDQASNFESGVAKARYLGIDTPESTGVIQEYGKQASNFTRAALTDAQSIIVESDTGEWNFDGNKRPLLWVWYRKTADAPYRLLNLELLQEGLAWSKSSNGVKYESICVKAYNQAVALKIKLHSGEPDPLFFYNDAIQVDLKYLRTHTEELAGSKVAFTAIIAKRYGKTLYVQSWNEEDQMYYGMTIFYGYTCDFESMLRVGDEMYFVADATNSDEFGFQVSNLRFDPFITDPELTKNYIRRISSNNEVVFSKVDLETFLGKKTIKVYADASDEEGEEKEFNYGELVLNAAVSFENLYVYRAHTTSNGGSSDGAISLYCRDEATGREVTVRTIVLYENDKANSDYSNKITQDRYVGKTINAKGIVDAYNGTYQLEVSSVFDIEVLD